MASLEQQTSQAGAKSKALELAIQTIEKQFGRGSIMRLGNGQKPARRRFRYFDGKHVS